MGAAGWGAMDGSVPWSAPDPPARFKMPRLTWRRQSVVGLLVLVLVAVTVIGAERAPSSRAIPALPRIGTSQDVDQSDVADPYIVPVGAPVAGGATRTGAVLQ